MRELPSEWRWNATPSAGEPGIETWPSPEAAAVGAGAPWQPPTYDPDLNLLYVPTGQATPTYNGKSREGANLYTSSVVALNPDTGKMAWYYQFWPHDTHDWDATEVTILVDGTINGQPRKLLAQANRNGYFFTLDRTSGKPLVVKPFALSGGLVFSGDPSGNLIAFDAATGKILWHALLGAQLTNSPISYLLDGRQYVVVAAAESLFAFYLQ